MKVKKGYTMFDQVLLFAHVIGIAMLGGIGVKCVGMLFGKIGKKTF